MRRIGILVLAVGAATIGVSGTATAQQAELCDQVIGGIADATADSPIDDTTAGLQDSCNQSFEKPGVVADPVLCGLESDLTDLAEPLGEAVGGVHGALDDQIEPALDGVADIVDFDHPCDNTVVVTETNGAGQNGATAAGGSGTGAQVQAANAAADGGLPRTGGELFAGVGFGLASLGALIRRFIR